MGHVITLKNNETRAVISDNDLVAIAYEELGSEYGDMINALSKRADNQQLIDSLMKELHDTEMAGDDLYDHFKDYVTDMDINIKRMIKCLRVNHILTHKYKALITHINAMKETTMKIIKREKFRRETKMNENLYDEFLSEHDIKIGDLVRLKNGIEEGAIHFDKRVSVIFSGYEKVIGVYENVGCTDKTLIEVELKDGTSEYYDQRLLEARKEPEAISIATKGGVLIAKRTEGEYPSIDIYLQHPGNDSTIIAAVEYSPVYNAVRILTYEDKNGDDVSQIITIA